MQSNDLSQVMTAHDILQNAVYEATIPRQSTATPFRWSQQTPGGDGDPLPPVGPIAPNTPGDPGEATTEFPHLRKKYIGHKDMKDDELKIMDLAYEVIQEGIDIGIFKDYIESWGFNGEGLSLGAPSPPGHNVVWNWLFTNPLTTDGWVLNGVDYISLINGTFRPTIKLVEDFRNNKKGCVIADAWTEHIRFNRGALWCRSQQVRGEALKVVNISQFVEDSMSGVAVTDYAKYVQVFNDFSGSSSGGAERFFALLQIAGLIVHESVHYAGDMREAPAYSLHGYFMKRMVEHFIYGLEGLVYRGKIATKLDIRNDAGVRMIPLGNRSYSKSSIQGASSGPVKQGIIEIGPTTNPEDTVGAEIIDWPCGTKFKDSINIGAGDVCSMKEMKDFISSTDHTFRNGGSFYSCVNLCDFTRPEWNT